MTKIRVLVADDHKVLRDGLRLLINTQPDMEVIAEANNGRGAVALVEQLQPDVVVMDISMPELNGLKATVELRRLYSDIKILILTRHRDGVYLQQLLQAGASGYLVKHSASEELVRAIRAIFAGKSYLDPELTEQIVGSIAGQRAALSGGPAEKKLSEREEQVLRMIAMGYLNREIADRLQISIKTAEAHKANAMMKIGLKSRIDIVRYALLQGWLQDTGA